MTCNRLQAALLALILSVAAPAVVLAVGGSEFIAAKGQPASVSPGWPEGSAELVNDPLRTSGWNSWFSEWPNDVNQYAFEVRSTDDLNRLIEKLAAIQSDVRQIRLSHLKEPNGLGWVTCIPKGNKIPVIFSIGDQTVIDKWYKRVRKPFGKMEFTAAPVAVPPTLTIFAQNNSVKLDELKIPEGIDVSSGYVPTVFHRSNTTIEEEQEKKAAASKLKLAKVQLDPTLRAVETKIEAFVEKYKGMTKR